MQPKIFGYRGFIIKIVAHVLPSSIMSTVAPLKYVASIAIIERSEGRLSDHTMWIHPKGFYSTPDQAFDLGYKYAMQVIDDALIGKVAMKSIPGKSFADIPFN